MLEDAQERQGQSRVAKVQAEQRAMNSIYALMAAGREVDDADLCMGRLIYTLFTQGFPLSICDGDHFKIDEGMF